jgi:4-amino-4-deoxy-L-arabinose transferase-like glycosyltransferase
MAKKIYDVSKQICSIVMSRVDILFAIFMAGLSAGYCLYISKLSSPMWDGATYLENARNWVTNTPLFEPYRPPLISWLIATVWFFTGENWEAVKFLAAFFTIGAGILLYITLKKHKGGLFALAVTILTMLNTQVFFYSTQIYAEAISLFFLAATLMLVKLGRPGLWFLAGITAGLTFASRYPILLQAVAIIACESLARKNWKLGLRAAIGTIVVVSLVIMVMILKTGTFQMALDKDTSLTFLLSGFYFFNSINIWGIAVVLVPLALIFKKTYADKYNYVFIAWFVISILFWSASSSNHQYRFAIQFTPAVYYLAVLTIENFFSSAAGKTRATN